MRESQNNNDSENELGDSSAVVIEKSDGQSRNEGPTLLKSEISDAQIDKNSDFPISERTQVSDLKK
jgi:hypothetical protein